MFSGQCPAGCYCGVWRRHACHGTGAATWLVGTASAARELPGQALAHTWRTTAAVAASEAWEPPGRPLAQAKRQHQLGGMGAAGVGPSRRLAGASSRTCLVGMGAD